ncbi:SubName: Full=Uncharacterized protein {ECO:0000313/EMBL:CCA70165.1} [Serendipita indica DSM 11827]|nr:SubName: Full=Uncharacterized protein {ECO:0000313/EMBL:CCA70165.1} [Serendipita indica DSM 11827]
MTEKNRAELEKRSSLYTFDAEALDAIPPSERIMITDLPQDPEGTTPDKVGDTKYNAIKALLKGINDIEARELFGGDRVSYKGLESQGITSAEQLRTRNGKLTHET